METYNNTAGCQHSPWNPQSYDETKRGKLFLERRIWSLDISILFM